MKCDELKAYKGDVTIPVYGTIADAEVYLKKEADAAIAELKEFAEDACLERDDNQTAIAELKHTIDELVVVKKSAELILQNLLDCGLIKEWYFNGKFNAVLKADDPHLKIAELKQKLEDVQASMYCDVVDANMEIRRLKCALWIARAQRADDKARLFYFADTCGVKLNIDGYSNREKGHTRMCTARWWGLTWLKVERKCLAKAEEYK